jgi:hypothetical protein
MEIEDIDFDFEENDNINKEITWSEDHEKLLVEWADKALCYRWLHSKSNLMYYRLNLLFSIPVIIMSTLTGTANFAFQSYDKDIQNVASTAIGCVNILAGIITTVSQYLKIAELNEAHRVSTISWDKFYRNIKLELAKHPNERMLPLNFLKIYKEEFDRLIETSPDIKPRIINEFKKVFGNSKDPIILDNYKNITKPEILDELITTERFRHAWFKNEGKTDPIELQKLFEINKKKKTMSTYEKVILTFRTRFFELHNRYPMENEIIDNLKEKIPEITIKSLLEKIYNKEVLV